MSEYQKLQDIEAQLKDVVAYLKAILLELMELNKKDKS